METMEKHKVLLEAKKMKVELINLSQLLEENGFQKAVNAQDFSTVDQLKMVFDENTRLRDEMHQIVGHSIKERQYLEAKQRESFSEIPRLVSEQYKTAMD